MTSFGAAKLMLTHFEDYLRGVFHPIPEERIVAGLLQSFSEWLFTFLRNASLCGLLWYLADQSESLLLPILAISAYGQVVVQISSQQVLEGLARLSSEAASRAARLVELDVRSEVVNAMLAPAEHREAVAVEGKNQLNEIYKKGLLPVISRTAAAEQAYNGQKDAEVLRAEKKALTDQIKMLTGATSQADRALSDLLDAFDRGRLNSPITGTVSAVLANRGAVVRAGDPLLELVGDHRFVAAWIPVGRWYQLEVGQPVTIDAGNGKLPGKISRIGTVASALPREFQKAFTPTERLQLIWIEFDKNVTPPPYFTKVTVS